MTDYALISVVASEPHFVDHLAPIWKALPGHARGNFHCGTGERRNELALIRARDYHGIPARSGYLPTGSRGLCLVGAVGDLSRARSNSPRMRFAFTEHGSGITYQGGGASYVGSTKRPNVDVILVPNMLAKNIQDKATPEIEVVSLGSSPRLDPWAPGQPARDKALNRALEWAPSQPDRAMNLATIAMSWHWDCKIAPETRTALPWYRKKLDLVLDGPWNVIGHGHPRAWPTLKIVYDHWGIEKVRSFDHVMQRADCYVVDNSCVLPETPVLMADLTWCPAGDVQPGEQVIGLDEERTRPQRHPNGEIADREDRRFRTATVVANERRTMPCVRIRTTHGEMRVSATHPWLTRVPITHEYEYEGRMTHSHREAWSWVDAADLAVGDRVAHLVEPWDRLESRDAGWLAGMLDGEGCISVGKPSELGSRITKMSVSQNEGPILDELERVLADHKIGWTDQVTTQTRNRKLSCHKLTLAGDLGEKLRILGTIRPERLVKKAVDNRFWEGCNVSAQVQQAEILEIEDLGMCEVAVMQTDTATFIANGFPAHNSTLYEFAATGRPVVVLNCPRYRRDVHHGLRFWDHIPGIQCDTPEDLPGAIELALEDPPELREMREEAIAAVYPQHDGHATDRAVETLLGVWKRVRVKLFYGQTPVTEYFVRDSEGETVQAYLVEYEARTHARKIGGSFDTRTRQSLPA